MEMDGLNLALIILFNAVVCVTLPRVITLNWSKMLSQVNLSDKTKTESVSVQ
ncbi:hypothetical protein PCC7424_3805 [Gloeothece citriformis PCC 7424]|uniref:Uncharacterized protein n=1 Tax=Gloeothece citriformis (strain PCC 7424) TaxID=65393 RepID=B7KJA2_GLOC7|nr:hypothetical protein [Gloeothece citriformis]ACK72186.1 hypothetical protein PCC7424_3805 [Gloeothece citriformis PCC 7424]